MYLWVSASNAVEIVPKPYVQQQKHMSDKFQGPGFGYHISMLNKNVYGTSVWLIEHVVSLKFLAFCYTVLSKPLQNKANEHSNVTKCPGACIRAFGHIFGLLSGKMGTI